MYKQKVNWTLSSHYTTLQNQQLGIMLHKYCQKILLISMSGPFICLSIRGKSRITCLFSHHGYRCVKKIFAKACPSLTQKLLVYCLHSNPIFLPSAWIPDIYSSAQEQWMWLRKNLFEDPVGLMHDFPIGQGCLLNSYQRHGLPFYENSS